jgi:class 3 adenylate cyclase/tetratricopeptide (TPR) repeat protein
MQCPRCHHENSPKAKFCEECATPLVRTCSSCGTQLSSTAKFCPECARPADARGAQPRFASPEAYTPKHLAEKILTSKVALEGERKQVTVLFADLKGSMELLADRDPEEARKLLDPVLERMMEAVHRYEGTVNQVMGDGIMALFGAPLAHEDHAVRACYAALRMQESVKRYADGVRRSEGVLVQIRVGLNSGEVVVRSVGSDLRTDYSAVGQTTHLAARMEQVAAPGTILLTPDTLALAEGFVQVTPLGPMSVKGLPAPVEVYELAGASAARSRLHAAAARGLTRFVGRDPEMEHLRRAFAPAAEGRGQVVAVVGEPGVGKSRLYHEFIHSHRTEGWLLLEASSVSYGKATSYFPVIGLLRTYFRIHDGDTHRQIREKVIGKLLTLDEALRSALPPLLALLEVPAEDAEWAALDPSQRRQRTLEAVKRLVLRESQVQPVLAIFEDLHWVDSETQAVLDALVDSIPAARVLLLVNYRPEYGHAWGSKTCYTQLRLDALPPAGAAALLDALLGSDATVAPLRSFLATRTAGNPFFLEESVRALVETKALVGERGAYRLARPLDAVQVPATVQAILAARIDRLPPEDKTLLQAAAVVGKEVPLPLLLAIADLSEDGLRRGLGHLQQAEFLYETGLFPDPEYTFKHALTHEVAYGGVLHDRRRALHAQIVAAMEARYADRVGEHVERLAYHALRGELWEKAVACCRQAGRKAVHRSAYAEAAAQLATALAALQHLPESREILEQGVDIRHELGIALFPIAGPVTQLGPIDEAEALAMRLGDMARLARVRERRQNSLMWHAEYPAAIELGEQLLSLSDSPESFLIGVGARFSLAWPLVATGELRRGVACFRENLSALQGEHRSLRTGHHLNFALSASSAPVALAELGDFEGAEPMALEGMAAAESEAGRPVDVAFALWTRGWVKLRQGEFHKARSVLERSRALCLQYGLVRHLPFACALLGVTHANLGCTDLGRPLLEDGIREAERLEALWFHALFLTWLAECHVLAGELEAGEAMALRAQELARARHERLTEGWNALVLGDIYSAVREHDTDHALGCYQRALAIAAGRGMRPLVAHCHLGLGKLFRRTGRRQEAQEHLTTATTMYREMGMRFWLEQAEADRDT